VDTKAIKGLEETKEIEDIKEIGGSEEPKGTKGSEEAREIKDLVARDQVVDSYHHWERLEIMILRRVTHGAEDVDKLGTREGIVRHHSHQ
jgi:hypothetical protein